MERMHLLSLLGATTTLAIGKGYLVTGFSVVALPSCDSPQTKLHSADLVDFDSNSPNPNNNKIMQRRTLITNFSALSFLLAPITPNIANADSIPSITSADFDIILKDSAKSILAVELSGPKSETAIVKLVDGTTFAIGDLVESSTDPRSPLKLVARCRLFKIPVKNTGLADALPNLTSVSGKKKKNFANTRVQQAEKLNEEARARMAEDERERLEELYKSEPSL